MAKKPPASQELWGENLKSILREYAESLLIAIVIAFALRYFVFGAYYISVPSMDPNFLEGDFVIGYKPPFGFSIPFSGDKWAVGKPRRGEVVIFNCPSNVNTKCMKRIVGLSGDRVEFKNNQLWVNGEASRYQRDSSRAEVWLEQTLGEKRAVRLPIEGEPRFEASALIVPPGQVYVLGDNRQKSNDSRDWGPVPLSGLESRALLVWLSIDWGEPTSSRWLPKVRWKRFFSLTNSP